MNRTLTVWAAAFVITAGSAYFQRVTGPTYPLTGIARVGAASVPFRLERSHGGESDARVTISAPDTAIRGTLEWKRYRTDDPWKSEDLARNASALTGTLPLQPPAGKLVYRVELRAGSDTTYIPAEVPAVIRFKGDVPAAILIVHILLMFTGMLFSTRTGLSAFAREEYAGRSTLLTIGFLTAGGLIMGPIVQKYAFGAYWTGWPFGTDLTDNKTVAALAAWIAVALVHGKVRRPAYWSLAAACITLAVFMIPHSLFGSELDYGGGGNPKGVPSVSALTGVHADERAADGRRHGGV